MIQVYQIIETHQWFSTCEGQTYSLKMQRNFINQNKFFSRKRNLLKFVQGRRDEEGGPVRL